MMLLDDKPLGANRPHHHQGKHVPSRSRCSNRVSQRAHRRDANMIEQRHHTRLSRPEEEQTQSHIDRRPKESTPLRDCLQSKP
ncbi:hypothetical protein [Pirellula sp. SH-Sr6A]|uniref:hypothetical protein n=1 Tax=Pirellula sp. SH-Sr6A TaxID=1632865 RepID=UPI0011BA811D|nr:hypothetical protein [Pirellula sp. SH-Sr6A]